MTINIRKNLKNFEQIDEGLLDILRLAGKGKTPPKGPAPERIEPTLTPREKTKIKVRPGESMDDAIARISAEREAAAKAKDAATKTADDSASASQVTNRFPEKEWEYTGKGGEGLTKYREYRNLSTGKFVRDYEYGLPVAATTKYGLSPAAKGIGFTAKTAAKHPFATAGVATLGGLEAERQGYLEPGSTFKTWGDVGRTTGNVAAALGPTIGTAVATGAAGLAGAAATGLDATRASAAQKPTPAPPPSTPPTKKPSPYDVKPTDWKNIFVEPAKESKKMQSALNEYKNFIKNL